MARLSVTNSRRLLPNMTAQLNGQARWQGNLQVRRKQILDVNWRVNGDKADLHVLLSYIDYVTYIQASDSRLARKISVTYDMMFTPAASEHWLPHLSTFFACPSKRQTADMSTIIGGFNDIDRRRSLVCILRHSSRAFLN